MGSPRLDCWAIAGLPQDLVIMPGSETHFKVGLTLLVEKPGHR
jgi:hypothetical protein